MTSPNELSFLPDDYLERKAQRRTNAICAVLFLVVMVVIGSAFSYTDRSVRALEREHEQVTMEYTDAARRIDLVKQLQDKQKKMATQAELAASLLEKVPRSFVLAEITNSLPAGVSLLDLTMESKLRNIPAPPPKTAFDAKRADANKPAVEAPKLYDVTLRVSGVAFTDVQVAQFITRLNQSKMLSDVNLVISDEFKQNDQELRRFQIEAQLDPDADITAQKVSGTAAIEIKEN